MGIFRRKKVRDYLEDEDFKKEYQELLRQRKAKQNKKDVEVKTAEETKALIKEDIDKEKNTLTENKASESDINESLVPKEESEIIQTSDTPVQTTATLQTEIEKIEVEIEKESLPELAESEDEELHSSLESANDYESFELEYIKESTEMDEGLESSFLKNVYDKETSLDDFQSETIPVTDSEIDILKTEEVKETLVEAESQPKEVQHEAEPEEIKKEETEEVKASSEEEKLGIIARLRHSLSKTKKNILDKLNRIISANSVIDDDVLDEIEEALYTSDIGVKTTQMIIENIRKSVKEQKYEDITELKTIIQNEIVSLVKTEQNLAKADFKTNPYVILVVGVNGNGKTTTIGKLAHYYKQKGKKVLIGAADTFRAAAIEQLEEWAVRSGSGFVKHKMNADPAAVAYDSYQASLARDIDVLLIDTAGRLHTKVNLMKELEKISRVLKKLNVDAPHEVLLVLDATTGQNAVSQARQFNLSTGITGLVLTKLDGTAKGGVAIAINQELNIPVKFIGVGEQINDLQEFDPKKYVEAIFS